MPSNKFSECDLVKTKFIKPRLSSLVLARPDVHKKLDVGLERKLTLVIAPAGCGKSTAVLEWLNSKAIPSAWLSLDANDNNPIIFWKYVCTALGNTDSVSGPTWDYMSSAHGLLENQVRINALINQMADIREDVILVLDNLQRIENMEIITGLDYLIEYLPPKMHLFLLSRKTPEIRLIRKEYNSQVLRIGFKQLKFDKDAVAEFFSVRGWDLDAKDVRQIEATTNGWPAALVAIAMAMENGDEPENILACIAGCRRGIDQYLLEEVFESFSEEKRDFLYQVSILECLCRDLCFAITGNPNCEAILQEMSDRNEFIVAFNEDRCKYRFNPIFRDFLLQQVRKADPEQLTKLYEKAARWSETYGLPVRAISYYLHAQNYDKAVSLMEDQLGVLVAKNDYETAEHLLARLPMDYRAQSIRIACFYTLYYAERSLFDNAIQWSERARMLAERAADASFGVKARTAAGLTRAFLLIRMERVDEFIRLIEGLGEAPELFKALDCSFEFNHSDIYFLRCPVSRFAMIAGENPQLLERIQAILSRIMPVNSGYPTLALGEYYYETNQLTQALPLLLKAAEAGSIHSSAGSFVPAFIDIARIERGRLDLDGYREVLEECARKLESIPEPHWKALLEAFRITHEIETDHPEPVSAWIRARDLGIFNEISARTEYELLVYSRALLAMDKLEDADLLLQRLLLYTREAGRKHAMVEVLCLLAILNHLKSDHAGSVECMEQALATGLAEGYFRVLADEGEALAEPIKGMILALRKRDGDFTDLIDYAKRILHQIHQESRKPLHLAGQDSSVSIRNLMTPKELEVLKLVVSACSNDEIGSKLGIKLRTVKTHTANIYGKLGVANRLQCIKLVNELHLFPSLHQTEGSVGTEKKNP